MPISVPFLFVPYSKEKQRINNSFIQRIFIEYLLCARCFGSIVSYHNKLDTSFCPQGSQSGRYDQLLVRQGVHTNCPFYLKWGHREKKYLGCTGLMAYALFLVLGSNLRMCGIPAEQLHTIFWDDESSTSVFPDPQQWRSLGRRAKLILSWLVLLGTLFRRIWGRKFQIFLPLS